MKKVEKQIQGSQETTYMMITMKRNLPEKSYDRDTNSGRIIKPYLILLIFLSVTINVFAQNKSGYTWIVGFNGSFAKFDGTSSAPSKGQLFNTSHPNSPFMYQIAHSNICDSITGEIVLSTTGMILYNAQGDIIENGDSLQPEKAYLHNPLPLLPVTQGSIIIPKGTYGQYYVFIPTVSDSLYNLLWTNVNGYKAPFDLLRYNIVDMNLNGGAGKVVVKNKVLLKDIELSKVMMQACKHSNGKDWWLLKHALNDNIIYRFLVTKDSIFGPFTQSFPQPKWGYGDVYGQSAFSKNGKKYAAVMGSGSKLFLADFDRCSGELINPNIFNIPIDSTTHSYWDGMGVLDSVSTGVCFSPNDNFLYIDKMFNIYQYEINQPDSNLAWYHVKHGFDTTQAAFEDYGQLYRAPNNRIYIGKVGGSLTQFSVIDYPNSKGAACGFCRKCFRIDNAQGGLTAPPNMPDYDLGPELGVTCWPLGEPEIIKVNTDLKVYPNPASTMLYIKTNSKEKRMLYNAIGQLLYETDANEMYISGYTKGLYYIKVGSAVSKIVVE
ncbi:MAG: T9SS type A sorting domain-containing protein [Chitinophagaceae bacterium]|nr:T9SS type A sorting domain-containing protein [Chitinophagaceae bacterium]